MKAKDIARVCHEANRALCIAQADFSQPTWDKAPSWQKISTVNGVQHRINNPSSTPEDSHISWTEEKLKAGWVYGEKKDVEKKTHPCLVSYNKLPKEQKAKDILFIAIVDALKNA